MRHPHILITVALLLSCGSATAGIPRTQAQKTIEEICAREPLRSALVGVLAVRADGDTLAAVNFRTRMVPASNVKLLTTGMALHTLGADYRFETKLAYSGTLEDGVLKGDLYILGGETPRPGPARSMRTAWARRSPPGRNCSRPQASAASRDASWATRGISRKPRRRTWAGPLTTWAATTAPGRRGSISSKTRRTSISRPARPGWRPPTGCSIPRRPGCATPTTP